MVCATSRFLIESVKFPKHTSASVFGMSSILCAVKKPSDPIANASTGGMAFGKYLDVHKIVPSPPKTTTKSMILYSLKLSSTSSHVLHNDCSASNAFHTVRSSHGVTPLARSTSTASIKRAVAAES